MIAFCQAIQYASPINAHVTPYPSYMPGYEDDVIMAAGTFVQGASIELSADGAYQTALCCVCPRRINLRAREKCDLQRRKCFNGKRTDLGRLQFSKNLMLRFLTLC